MGHIPKLSRIWDKVLVNMTEYLERFAELMSQGERLGALDEAGFLLAGHVQGELDVAGEQAKLDQLATDVPVGDLDGVLEYIFGTLGFQGNERSYYDPRNSYLNEVLQRRLGIPISLSVLVMEVARRLDIELDGVSMPGHFLLCDRSEPRVFVDSFNQGAQLSATDCEKLFWQHAPAAADFQSGFQNGFLEPVSLVTVAERMLSNLVAIHYGGRNVEALRRVCELLSCLPEADEQVYEPLVNLCKARADFQQAAELCRLQASLCDDPVPQQRYEREAMQLLAFLN